MPYNGLIGYCGTTGSARVLAKAIRSFAGWHNIMDIVHQYVSSHYYGIQGNNRRLNLLPQEAKYSLPSRAYFVVASCYYNVPPSLEVSEHRGRP